MAGYRGHDCANPTNDMSSPHLEPYPASDSWGRPGSPPDQILPSGLPRRRDRICARRTAPAPPDSPLAEPALDSIGANSAVFRTPTRASIARADSQWARVVPKIGQSFLSSFNSASCTHARGERDETLHAGASAMATNRNDRAAGVNSIDLEQVARYRGRVAGASVRLSVELR